MIIKREYATYGQLVSDKPSKDAIIKIFDKYEIPQDIYEFILNPYNDLIVRDTDMNSGIPGKAYQELRELFTELDKTDPFDNGLTYRDVTSVATYASRKGTAITQVLYCEKAEKPRVIVQIVAFEHKNGETYFIEPWNFARDYL